MLNMSLLALTMKSCGKIRDQWPLVTLLEWTLYFSSQVYLDIRNEASCIFLFFLVLNQTVINVIINFIWYWYVNIYYYTQFFNYAYFIKLREWLFCFKFIQIIVIKFEFWILYYWLIFSREFMHILLPSIGSWRT